MWCVRLQETTFFVTVTWWILQANDLATCEASVVENPCLTIVFSICLQYDLVDVLRTDGLSCLDTKVVGKVHAVCI